jgi:hypothetical protein
MSKERFLPNAKSYQTVGERDKIQKSIARLSICGLANDTKWDELINEMRRRREDKLWVPGFRFKCIDGPPRPWDVEWYYHLPFPMISVEWFDIGFEQRTVIERLPRQIQMIDHSPWLEELLKKIGLDFQKGKALIRIFGYAPRNLTGIDE